MNPKQTPEQAALEALQIYADGQESSQGFGENYTAARQSIIKAFQDRERLLAVLEGIITRDENFQQLPRNLRVDANAAISKAKDETC